ncbi:MAG: glycoside hydrolase family 3 N-terminal domain-containing protein [Candidatus Marinimicrobia bacterium]|jgi:beta-glucosidase-like glycosyl hydrolase/CubicO group peptidase (beta-lactamase class C family)|nr:glycoside hydrolase family 3 N-terminal domain-containing protein [Candidatus Neomarinimicrobiota bacterium]MDP6611228.1 glycoside hydrolase family 3 N-terminal domain-containing protein [Candidatus Neomarinimicrobiota bacterium]
MRKFILCLALLLSACAGPGEFISNKSWAEKTLRELTLREKIAQMMVVGINMRFMNYGSREWQNIQNHLATDGIGVLHIWFGDAGSALTMLNTLQAKSKVPILVDADIESGLGRRYPGAVTLPPMMAIAATGDPKYAYEAGRISAEESRAVGIHFNLSPVVDVNNNPKNPIINTRSFGEVPDSVNRYSVEYIRGLHEYGMLATAKHFPGHGDTETDSHSALAQIPSDSARLWQTELPPFKRAIDAGVDAVMVAHVNAPDYQDHAQDPSSLSRFWLQDILREKMNFDGVIITDAMRMGGIVKNYSDEYALLATVQAGSDIVIQNQNLKKSIDIIEKAVLNGAISESRIDASALKVLKMKEKVGLHLDKKISADLTHRVMGKAANFKLAKEMAEKAITVVKNEGDILPLQPALNEKLYVVDLYDGPNNHSESSFTKKLKTNGRKVVSFQIDESDSTAISDFILSQIPEDGLVFLNMFANPTEHKDEIFLPKVEADFVNRLIGKCERVIITSFGSPYLIQDFPNAPVYICAYKSSGILQIAAVNAITGKADITGILPVSIPSIAANGTGIKVKAKRWPNGNSQLKPGQTLKRITPSEISVKTDSIQLMLNQAVMDSAWPGGVLLAVKDGKIFFHDSFGYHTYQKAEPVTRGDIYDLASITKVIATTSAIMRLVDQKKLSLDDSVVDYLPAFKGRQQKYFDQKSATTIRHLMTHSAGLPPFKQYYLMNTTPETRLDSVMNTEPTIDLANQTIYSDVGLITLGKVVEAISGVPLDSLVDSLIFDPLGMGSTYFNPPKERMKRIVPTEYSDLYGELIRGYVHDENAHSLGGIAGHAGLFSTASDLAIFSQMMLNGGKYGWKRIFKEETVQLFTTRANVVEGSSRALGWDTPSGKVSGGVYLSDNSFGHTGYTGTSLWIDSENQMIVILLTNAVHPNRSYKDPKYFDWRQRIHSALYEAVGIREQNPSLEWRREWD